MSERMDEPAEGSLDGDPMSETEPPQAATGGRGSEGGEHAARPATAGVRGNKGGGGIIVFPQLRRETLPDTSPTYPSSAVVEDGSDLVIRTIPTHVGDSETNEWAKHLSIKNGKTFYTAPSQFHNRSERPLRY